MPPVAKQNTPSTEIDSVSQTNYLKWLLLGFSLLIFIVLVMVIAWQFNIFPLSNNITVSSEEKTSPTAQSSLWTFPYWNFSLTRNPEWTLVSQVEQNEFPPSLKDENIIFGLKKGQCELVFIAPEGHQFIENSLQYLGTPSLIPPLPAGTRFSAGYAMKISQLPPHFVYDRNIEQHLPGELFLINVSDHNVIRRPTVGDPTFVLYNTSGDLVDKDCATEATSIVTSINSYYENAKLDTNSYGALYLKNGNLLFIDQTGVPRDMNKSFLTPYMQGGVELRYVPVPLVYDNKIFYPAGNVYNAFDPFTRQETSYTIPSVTSVLPAGDSLYLVGSPQNLSESPTYTLYRLLLSTGLVTSLGEIHTGFFAGYSEKLNGLYFVDGTGSMGCFSSTYEQFDIDSKQNTRLGTFSACNGDADYVKIKAQVQEIESNFDKQYSLVGGSLALIKDGEIIRPTGDENKWLNMIEWQSSTWNFASSTKGF